MLLFCANLSKLNDFTKFFFIFVETKTRDMTGNILPSKILCREIKRESKVTKSGIILEASILSKDPTITAEVVLVGSGAPVIGMPVSIGQVILFSPHAFQKVRVQEEDLILVDVRDILFYY
jgi:co-chaperonin GroES (HSP10)